MLKYNSSNNSRSSNGSNYFYCFYNKNLAIANRSRVSCAQISGGHL